MQATPLSVAAGLAALRQLAKHVLGVVDPPSTGCRRAGHRTDRPVGPLACWEVGDGGGNDDRFPASRCRRRVVLEQRDGDAGDAVLVVGRVLGLPSCRWDREPSAFASRQIGRRCGRRRLIAEVGVDKHVAGAEHDRARWSCCPAAGRRSGRGRRFACNPPAGSRRPLPPRRRLPPGRRRCSCPWRR